MHRDLVSKCLQWMSWTIGCKVLVTSAWNRKHQDPFLKHQCGHEKLPSSLMQPVWVELWDSVLTYQLANRLQTSLALKRLCKEPWQAKQTKKQTNKKGLPKVTITSHYFATFSDHHYKFTTRSVWLSLITISHYWLQVNCFMQEKGQNHF